jgi:Fe-Mn family superoxide dismutase
MDRITRREFISATALVAASSVFAAPQVSAGVPAAFVLDPLSYPYEALEPYIDAETMRIHHDRHHQSYVDGLMKAVDLRSDLGNLSIENILARVSQYPPTVRNNGGGHFNHALFWKLLAPSSDPRKPSTSFVKAIDKEFGSIDGLKQKMLDAGLQRFGSGWVWLIKDSKGTLVVCSTPNQDNPLMDITEVRGQPLLAIDVWEHAYYLKYQNRRADYLKAVWEVINWRKVSELFEGRSYAQ